jgi:hypothetical protein
MRARAALKKRRLGIAFQGNRRAAIRSGAYQFAPSGPAGEFVSCPDPAVARAIST